MPEPKLADREICYGIARAQYNDGTAGCDGLRGNRPERLYARHMEICAAGQCAGLGGSLNPRKRIEIALHAARFGPHIAFMTHYTDPRGYLYQPGLLDPDGAQRITREALKACDDGELYLQYSATESFGFDDGRLKMADYSTGSGFGLRGVSGEMTGFSPRQ